MKRFFYSVAVVVLVFMHIPEIALSKNEPKGNPPVITASFAVERGFYGYVWKIYIEADDPDGDMAKIAAVVHQPGYGYYPADWILLKPPYQRHLKGYIQWNTYSSRTTQLREWTNITLKISISDKTGNESNEVVFPFEFVTGVRPKIKLPPLFDEVGLPRLGYIHIDLFEPTLMGTEERTD